MSQVTIIMGPDALAHAASAARAIGPPPISGAAAPLSAAVIGLFNDMWDFIEDALADAYRSGAEKVAELYQETASKVDDIMGKAGSRAREVHDMIVKRLAAYSQQLIRDTLASMADVVRVGGVDLSLASVTCTQKLLVGGSIKASIKELIQLLANGEISVQASYTRSSGPASTSPTGMTSDGVRPVPTPTGNAR